MCSTFTDVVAVALFTIHPKDALIRSCWLSAAAVVSIALELVCCRYPDQDKDPVTSDSLVTTLSLLAPVIFSFCTPLLPFLSGPHLQHWRWLPRLAGNKILIHVSLYLVSLIILWCEGSGKGNVIGICGSGVRCGAGAGFWGGGHGCLVTYHWPRPQL